jgi:hypothetical protein
MTGPRRVVGEQRRGRWLVLLLGCAAIGGCIRQAAAPLPAGPALHPAMPGMRPSIAAGDHYRIICDFENDAVARAALQIAEAAWPFAADLLELPMAPLARPLDIHLYRTIEDYEFAEGDLSPDSDPHALVFSLPLRHESHIVVQPVVSGAVLATIGLTSMTRGLIAFHAVRLAIALASPYFPLHPAWYVAGIEQWASLRALKRIGLMGDETQEPLWSTDMLALQRWHPGEAPATPTPNGGITNVAYRTPKVPAAMPTTSDIFLEDLPDAGQGRFLGLAWVNFETLMSPPYAQTTRALLREVRATGTGYLPGREADAARLVRARVAARAAALYGPTRLAELDRDLRQRVAGLKPQWEEMARSLDTVGRDWRQIAFGQTWVDGRNAMAWHVEPAPSPAFTISGRATILGNPGRQLNVLLRFDDDDFLQVSFVANKGVRLWKFERRKNAWADLGFAPSRAFPVGQSFMFVVSHRSGVVTVSVNEEVMTTLKLDRPINGRWGLGAYQGSAGIWSDIVVAAAPGN